MRLRIIILVLSIVSLSNLAFTQTDSLFGKEVAIHLHKTKESVKGEFRLYENNRVTVLFDNSLHDYFYPNIEFLSFEGFDVRFTSSGAIIKESSAAISEANSSGLVDNNKYLKSLSTGENHLILQNNKNSKTLVMNLNKKIKVRLKNYEVIKSKSVEIINDSLLKFNSRNYKKHTIVAVDNIIQIKGYKIQRDEITSLGQATTVVGIITIPYLIGVPLIIASKYIKGYKSTYLDKWSLKVL